MYLNKFYTTDNKRKKGQIMKELVSILVLVFGIVVIISGSDYIGFGIFMIGVLNFIAILNLSILEDKLLEINSNKNAQSIYNESKRMNIRNRNRNFLNIRTV